MKRDETDEWKHKQIKNNRGFFYLRCGFVLSIANIYLRCSIDTILLFVSRLSLVAVVVIMAIRRKHKILERINIPFLPCSLFLIALLIIKYLDGGTIGDSLSSVGVVLPMIGLGTRKIL